MNEPVPTIMVVLFVICAMVASFMGGYLTGWSEANDPVAKAERQRRSAASSGETP